MERRIATVSTDGRAKGILIYRGRMTTAPDPASSAQIRRAPGGKAIRHGRASSMWYSRQRVRHGQSEQAWSVLSASSDTVTLRIRMRNRSR